MDHLNRVKKYLLAALFGSALLSLAGCGSSSSVSPAGDSSSSSSAVVSSHSSSSSTASSSNSLFWQTVTPDLKPNANRPVIALIGAQSLHLNVGDAYSELGATLTDPQEGDISDQLVISPEILETTNPGDYLVRYQGYDSDGNAAVEALRIIRVYDATPALMTKRPVGTTLSHFGYYERLPTQYNQQAANGYPLIIYHHGSGSNVSSFGGNAQTALDALINWDGGLATAIQQASWNQDWPFIILIPQRGDRSDIDPARTEAFVEFAKASYNIDPNRIYMAGYSQGALTSLLYAVEHPDKIAALASVAGGFFSGVPSNVCQMAEVPLWGFYGSIDHIRTFPVAAHDAINACSPSVSPKLTVYPGVDHFSSQFLTFALTGLNTASSTSDPYNTPIYDWLLSHSLEQRQQ